MVEVSAVAKTSTTPPAVTSIVCERVPAGEKAWSQAQEQRQKLGTGSSAVAFHQPKVFAQHVRARGGDAHSRATRCLDRNKVNAAQRKSRCRISMTDISTCHVVVARDHRLVVSHAKLAHQLIFVISSAPARHIERRDEVRVVFEQRRWCNPKADIDRSTERVSRRSCARTRSAM